MPAPRVFPPARVALLGSISWLAFGPLASAQTPSSAHAPAPVPPAASPAAIDPNAPPPLDPAALRRGLDAHPTGDAALRLADKLRRWFGADVLRNGMAAKTEGLDAAF